MTIASLETLESLTKKGFRKASNGFYLSDFKKVNPHEKLPYHIVSQLREKRFSDKQISYIAGVLSCDEIGVISDHLEDALYIAIINSMSEEKFDWFYHTFEPDPAFSALYNSTQYNVWVKRAEEFYSQKTGFNKEKIGKEIKKEIELFVQKRFRAYWRMRYPEKSIKVIREPVRRNYAILKKKTVNPPLSQT